MDTILQKMSFTNYFNNKILSSGHDLFFCPRCGGRIAGEESWEEEPEYTTLSERITEINAGIEQFFTAVCKAMSRIAAKKSGKEE